MKFKQALDEKIIFYKPIGNYIDTDLECVKDLLAARKGGKAYGVWIRPYRMNINHDELVNIDPKSKKNYATKE
jgi:hypothetical protein